MPRALPQDTQDSIKSALMSNRSPKDIAGEFGIHPKTVRRYRNKLFGPMVPATRGSPKDSQGCTSDAHATWVFYALPFSNKRPCINDLLC
ncbi:hypothetical protein G6F24_014153 [Rhizopus arrhizus]|nr:hypothetical protein G6F24_014153 [Rhizopus arrhizus]